MLSLLFGNSPVIIFEHKSCFTIISNKFITLSNVLNILNFSKATANLLIHNFYTCVLTIST